MNYLDLSCLAIFKEDSIETIETLRKNKFTINILSGDRKQTVVEFAKKLVATKVK